VTLLLDTHALLWWMAGDPRVPPRIEATLQADGTAFVSAASIWEIEIKQARGRLRVEGDLGEHVASAGLQPLPITFDHAVAAARLPARHADPFDRMLVAQARVEGLVLATCDRRVRQYDVRAVCD